MTERYIVNICALGDGQVGKTSITRRYVDGAFTSDYKKTIGIDISRKEIELDGTQMTMMIHDPSGQKMFERVQNDTISHASGAIILCDMTRKTTFENLNKNWIGRLSNLAPQMPFVLIGNKNEVPEKEVDYLQIERLSGLYDMPYYLTSAKTGENVIKTFDCLGRMILSGKKPKY